jgi:hypothetical protein
MPCDKVTREEEARKDQPRQTPPGRHQGRLPVCDAGEAIKQRHRERQAPESRLHHAHIRQAHEQRTRRQHGTACQKQREGEAGSFH